MSRLVQEFSANCFSDAEKIQHVARITADSAAAGDEIAVVVSPIASVSQFYDIAHDCAANPNPREMNMLLSGAEQIAGALLAIALQNMGCPARSIAGSEIMPPGHNPIHFANLRELNPTSIEHCFSRGEVPVISATAGSRTHMPAKDPLAGADLTAVALAYTLGAESCHCYIENGGVYTADPAIVPEARKISTLSYEEMLEFVSSGSNAASLKSLELALDTHVPLRLRSIETPGDMGTLVTHQLMASRCSISGIAIDDNQIAISISSDRQDEARHFDGVASFFRRLQELGIQTEMVMILNQEEEACHELRFTVPAHSLRKVVSIIQSNNDLLGEHNLHVEEGLTSIALVGHGLSERNDIIANVFETINSAQIPVRMVTASNLKVGMLVASEFARQTVQLIHRRLNLGFDMVLSG